MMFNKLSKNSSVKNILVISLSNVGDAVLIAPVMDVLLRDFPSARLSLVIGSRAASLFEGNPRIERIHIFDKNRTALQQAHWTWSLRCHHYDVVVDLRNSMIGYFLTPTWLTVPVIFPDRSLHLKDQHLSRLKSLYPFNSSLADRLAILPSDKDEVLVTHLTEAFLRNDTLFVFIAPFAADSAKTWTRDGFAQLCKNIADQYGLKIVMIGSPDQKARIEEIINKASVPILNLAGCTNLIQIAALIKRATIAVVHDSGPMHIASYFNKPVVALFGPTNPKNSAPWSSRYKVVRRNDHCVRCLNPKSPLLHQCMEAITHQEVMDAFKDVYENI